MIMIKHWRSMTLFLLEKKFLCLYVDFFSLKILLYWLALEKQLHTNMNMHIPSC